MQYIIRTLRILSNNETFWGVLFFSLYIVASARENRFYYYYIKPRGRGLRVDNVAESAFRPWLTIV